MSCVRECFYLKRAINVIDLAQCSAANNHKDDVEGAFNFANLRSR